MPVFAAPHHSNASSSKLHRSEEYKLVYSELLHSGFNPALATQGIDEMISIYSCIPSAHRVERWAQQRVILERARASGPPPRAPRKQQEVNKENEERKREPMGQKNLEKLEETGDGAAYRATTGSPHGCPANHASTYHVRNSQKQLTDSGYAAEVFQARQESWKRKEEERKKAEAKEKERKRKVKKQRQQRLQRERQRQLLQQQQHQLHLQKLLQHQKLAQAMQQQQQQLQQQQQWLREEEEKRRQRRRKMDKELRRDQQQQQRQLQQQKRQQELEENRRKEEEKAEIELREKKSVKELQQLQHQHQRIQRVVEQLPRHPNPPAPSVCASSNVPDTSTSVSDIPDAPFSASDIQAASFSSCFSTAFLITFSFSFTSPAPSYVTPITTLSGSANLQPASSFPYPSLPPSSSFSPSSLSSSSSPPHLQLQHQHQSRLFASRQRRAQEKHFHVEVERNRNAVHNSRQQLRVRNEQQQWQQMQAETRWYGRYFSTEIMQAERDALRGVTPKLKWECEAAVAD
ncbi:hypothetical protein BDD12DRAFT_947521 [Trichophaea hybrida]|nr:hypothetical protein BDD12DRAFT_947521 [Trichophaea hybrida]